ncbi:glucose dehydrogenase-like [Tropilaelaps mercedesae]|uniref:Glucose dehydrogenase-like n=1 Tax=Tropilaelaps mercedesae TaxID=418985 RepID=A0A1V9XT89_9ACAR|nr:glucose dehydrogenase-like [Tropilaelaps mercedesae]
MIAKAATLSDINMIIPQTLIAIAVVSNALHASFNGTRLKDLQDVYDFIVVGGGSAGCRVAERLSSNASFKVLLIEAGGVPPESSKIPMLATLAHGDLRFDWQYKTVPQKTSMQAARDNVRTISAGRVLGGGSTLNFMAYQRGNRDDYDTWEAKHGANGWNFDEVLKVFKEVENSDDLLLSDEYYGRSGPLGVTTYREAHPIKNALYSAFTEELSLDYSDQNDGNHWGYYDMVSTTKRGRRVSSFNAFIEPNIHRPNLDFLLHAQVTKVLIEDGHAMGVSFVRDGIQRTVRAFREVVLSAGALRSPQLLMLSGIGDQKHLEQHKVPVVHHLPGVGQNLQDHYGYLGIVAEIPDDGIPDLKDIDSLHQWLLEQTGPFAYPSGTQMGFMYFSTKNNEKQPDIEVIPLATKNLRFETDLRQEVFLDFYGPLYDKSTLHMLLLIQHPESRGEVRLANADGESAPLIDPKYFSHPDDLEKAVNGGRQLLRVMRSDKLRAANITLHERPIATCAHLQLFSDDYLRCLATHHTIEVFHPCGTCKIGKADDPLAVVDERLRVRGVKGLRVADNSVMPSITAGHLNAPATLIGSKAGQMILEDCGVISTASREEL